MGPDVVVGGSPGSGVWLTGALLCVGATGATGPLPEGDCTGVVPVGLAESPHSLVWHEELGSASAQPPENGRAKEALTSKDEERKGMTVEL